MKDWKVVNEYDIFYTKSRIMMLLKSMLGGFCLLSLLGSCSEDVKYSGNEKNDFHTINVSVDDGIGIYNSHKEDTRAANQAGRSVRIEDLVLFTVDKRSTLILNTSLMEKRTDATYSCRIPPDIDLSAAEFYAVANVKVNFGEFAQFEGTYLYDFFSKAVNLTNDDNNLPASSSSALSYALVNRKAATYDSATGTISDITLSHLPSRIYLDCGRLGYPVKKVTINNVARTTFLSTVIDKSGNGKNKDLINWTDTRADIAGDGTDYYYLVYPSTQAASLVITTADKKTASANLGKLKPGYSYTVRINYPLEISFDEIATDGKIGVAQGDILNLEFKVFNTAVFREIELSSSDESVFKVKGGTEANWNKFSLEGVGPGEATLTAKCMDITISCIVVVSEHFHSVTVNGEAIGSYAAGETVTIQAPFIEFKKFSHWTNDSETPLSVTVNLPDLNAPTLTFTMPASAVSFTAEYADAPYKITINKPGTIVNSRSGDFEPALVKETMTGYIRYYAPDDEVRISCPDAVSGRKFRIWHASDNTFSNIYYYINNNGGGGQRPTTWFKMAFSADAELSPTYINAPYWSTRSTTKGHIVANFIDRLNDNPGQLTIPGGGTTFHRAYTQQEKEVIMRALNTIENTFANAPRRTIKISFAVFNRPGSSETGGATEPVIAYYAAPYDRPKTTWLATDFDGRAAGKAAVSSKFEAVWRDQLNIVPDDADADNLTVGSCDGYVLLNHSYIQDLYKGEDESGIGIFQNDFESLIMHEVGHIVCYHSFNEAAGPIYGMHALDVFIANASDPENKNIVNGTFEDDGEDPIIYNNLVKSYFGSYVRVMFGDIGHLAESGQGVGSFGMLQGRCIRRFADFELALLQEMGWEINPAAWKNPPGSR